MPVAKPTRAPPPTPFTIHPLTKPTTSFDALPFPAYIKPNNDDCDDTIPSRPTLLAIQFHSQCGMANISLQALYHVINLVFNAQPTYTIPQALCKSPNCIHHIINIEEVCNGVFHPVTKETIMKYTKLMNAPNLKKLWVPAMSKELYWLVQGEEGITIATNTIFFLSHDKIRCIPKDCTFTHLRIVVNHWPQKNDPNRMRIPVGGTLSNYPYKLTTQTAIWFIMWNSIIGLSNAKFVSAYIKNMYLETPLDQYEYMKMPLWLIPEDIIKHCGLHKKALDGYVYMEFRKGMYGLPQAGILASKLLKLHLAHHGYFKQPHMPGL
jgi:hypothetical protein